MALNCILSYKNGIGSGYFTINLTQILRGSCLTAVRLPHELRRFVKNLAFSTKQLQIVEL